LKRKRKSWRARERARERERERERRMEEDIPRNRGGAGVEEKFHMLYLQVIQKPIRLNLNFVTQMSIEKETLKHKLIHHWSSKL